MRGESRVAAHDPVSTDLARAPWGTSAFRGTKASGVACDAPTAGREEGPGGSPLAVPIDCRRDSQTGVAPGGTRGRKVRSKCR